jgi:A/G-specific adenine glycosylase
VVEALLPADPATAARFGVAVMELGALICVARTPRCVRCPIRDDCAWLAAGAPAPAEPPRPRPAYAGSDRQVRGLLLGVLREAADPVARSRLDLVWGDVEQRARALDSLVRDGLVQPLPDGRYALGG